MENYKSFEEYLNERDPNFNEEADHWIKGAIKKPGALKSAAKKAGESKSEYCKNPPSTKGKQRCNLAKTLKRFN